MKSRRIQEAKDGVHAQHAPTYRRIAIGLLATLAFLMAISVLGFTIYGLRDHSTTEKLKVTFVALRAVEQQQKRQLIEGCERLNIQRSTSNQGFYSLYLAILSLKRTHRTQEEKKIEREAIKGLQWTPLTSCKFAVAESGVSYKAPLPIHFYTRQPPKSALSIKNASLPSPVDAPL